jgi:hypothetical protein
MGLTLAYYPAFEDGATLTDRFWRAVHYFGPVAERIAHIELAGTPPTVGAPPAYLDQSLPARAGPVEERLQWVAAPNVESADVVIVWDRARMADPVLRRARKVVVLDPAELHEGDLAIELGAELNAQFRAEGEIGRARLSAAIAQESREVAHVFGTGPSLAAIEIDSLPEGVSIVCNSVIKDEALMARLRPRFITAIDPIFHAGPSLHAAAFRAQLCKMLDVHRAWFVVQARDAHIYAALLPPHLRELIIAIPVRYALSPNLNLARRPWLTATRNVLTLTMLPLAAAVGREIRIYGCDGRRTADHDDFWRYAPGAAFDAERALQREAHPGFFTLDYQDYYALHCETMRIWIAAAEREGARVRAGTPSFIPALAARRLPGVPALEASTRSFQLQGRAAYWRRAVQSAYGAALNAPNAPGWLKRGLRATVRAARTVFR